MDSVKQSPEISWANCEAIKQAFNQSRARGTTFTVLLALAIHANKTGTAWPSIERLAALARTSVRTVKRALRELEAMGEITIVPQAGKNGVNLYRLELARGGDKLSPEAALLQGGANLTPEGTGAPGGQLDTRSAMPLQAAGGASLAGGGVNPTPKNNKEENKEKTSPLPPSTEPGTALQGEEAHPPAPEEEEEASKLSPKAEAIKDALGPELFAQLETLYTERAPRSRFVLWLETALHPELERLGRETFRAALAHHLPAAAGDGIRHPSRFLVAKLKAENPPKIAKAERPVKVLRDLLVGIDADALDNRPQGPGGLAFQSDDPMIGNLESGSRASDSRGARKVTDPLATPGFGRYSRRLCRYGDHEAGDACCLPKALETLAWVVPELERPHLDPVEADSLKEAAATAYRVVSSKPDGWGEALERLGERKQDALRALRVLGIEGAVGVANEKATTSTWSGVEVPTEIAVPPQTSPHVLR